MFYVNTNSMILFSNWGKINRVHHYISKTVSEAPQVILIWLESIQYITHIKQLGYMYSNNWATLADFHPSDFILLLYCHTCDKWRYGRHHLWFIKILKSYTNFCHLPPLGRKFFLNYYLLVGTVLELGFYTMSAFTLQKNG